MSGNIRKYQCQRTAGAAFKQDNALTKKQTLLCQSIVLCIEKQTDSYIVEQILNDAFFSKSLYLVRLKAYFTEDFVGVLP
jgi:hypothetical protein